MSNVATANISSQVVFAENVGPRPFSQEYANARYICDPGQRILIPWEAMCLWMGHPDAVDIDPKRRYRTEEFERLCVKWGVYEHHNRAKEEWYDDKGNGPFAPLFPQLVITRIEDNTRVITVVDDPEGKHLTPAVQSAADKARLEDQLAAMRAQMAAMAQQMTAMQSEQAANFAGADTRTDEAAVRPPNKLPEPVPPPVDPDAPLDALPEDEGDDAIQDSPSRVPVGASVGPPSPEKPKLIRR